MTCVHFDRARIPTQVFHHLAAPLWLAQLAGCSAASFPEPAGVLVSRDQGSRTSAQTKRIAGSRNEIGCSVYFSMDARASEAVLNSKLGTTFIFPKLQDNTEIVTSKTCVDSHLRLARALLRSHLYSKVGDVGSTVGFYS